MKFYTIEEIATLLKIHHTKVRELIKSGDLKSTRIGKQYRISQEQLEDYLKRHS